jgi:GAF domain-containing protein
MAHWGTEGVLALRVLPLRRSWRMSYHAGRLVAYRRVRSAPMPEEVSSLLSPALSELAGLLLSTASFTELVQEVAELTVRTVAPAATCGITLAQQDRVFTVAAANALANQLDEQQYELGDGPCLRALSSGEVVNAPDLRAESRWDSYPTIAMGHGILAVHSVPLIVDGKPVGVLNVYARTGHAFSAGDRQLMVLLAGQAAIAVTAALRHYDEVSLSDHLRIALSSRSVIDQAIGIVMAQQHGTAEQAFAALRTISQRRNIKLRVVATELVETIGRAGTEPTPSPG